MSTQIAPSKPISIVDEKPASLLDRIVEQQAETAARYKPVMSIQELIEREKAIQYLVDNVMVEGIDFGWIPGTRPKETAKAGEYQAKPTLFKSGAERACAFFGYAPRFSPQEVIEQWTADKYGEALFYYRYECLLTKDSVLVGSGIGSATTWESKYRYRASERLCPQCGKPNIRKSKPKPGKEPGFYCWEKTGGCGATFTADDEDITGQETGKVPNPDIADVVNTVQKMAQKRAYVAATLTATGLSGRFTQDLEDLPTPTKNGEEVSDEGTSSRRQEPGEDKRGSSTDRKIPEALKTVFANIDKDPSHVIQAFAMLEGQLIRKAGDIGAEKYGEIADRFNAAYPNGTSDRKKLKECVLELHDALQAIQPQEAAAGTK